MWDELYDDMQDEMDEIRRDVYEDGQEIYESEYGEEGDGTLTAEDYNLLE